MVAYRTGGCYLFVLAPVVRKARRGPSMGLFRQVSYPGAKIFASEAMRACSQIAEPAKSSAQNEEYFIPQIKSQIISNFFASSEKWHIAKAI